MRIPSCLLIFLFCAFAGFAYSAEIPGISEYLARKGDGAGHKIWRLSVLNSNNEDDIFVLIDTVDGKKGVLISGRFSKSDSRYFEEEYSISEVAISNIESFEVASNFWQLPEKNSSMGLDGAEWILEGKNGDVYHKVKRWSPFPPYYSMMYERGTKKLVKAPLMAGESDSKYSDEVGFDMLCLIIFMMRPYQDALIN